MDEGVSRSQLDTQLHFSPLDMRGPFKWIPSPCKYDSCYVSERLCLLHSSINYKHLYILIWAGKWAGILWEPQAPMDLNCFQK